MININELYSDQEIHFTTKGEDLLKNSVYTDYILYKEDNYFKIKYQRKHYYGSSFLENEIQIESIGAIMKTGESDDTYLDSILMKGVDLKGKSKDGFTFHYENVVDYCLKFNKGEQKEDEN